MRKTLWVYALLLLTVSLSANAQDELDKRKPPKPKPDCLDGTYYDDGKFETGLRSALLNDNFVMLVEAPSYPAKLEKVCIAWRRTSFWKDVYFDLRIWSADGPNGGPGKLIDTVPALAAGGVPTKAKFYTYDLTSYGIVLDGPIYIGPYWDPVDWFLIYLAMDTGPNTPRQRAFHGVGALDDHPPSVELGSSAEQAPNYRAFGIRAKFGPP
jgi:hypothetical protein